MRAGELLVGLLVLWLAAEAAGQVHKWVDKDGRVHYGAHPPPDAKAKPVAIQRSHSANPASGVEVSESKIQYYPVYGNSPETLHASMMQNGPFNQIVQSRVYAEIEWRLRWRFSYQREPGKCRIEKFVVTLDTTITMPQWMTADQAPTSMRNLWPRALAKIRIHEDGHKAIATEGANVLARRLQSLPAYEDCDALKREIAREGERIVAEYDLANRAFDRTEALKASPFRD
jgi:predicted secreted Zn-dependent protease